MTPDVRRLLAGDADAYQRLRDAMLASHPTAFTSAADEERSKPAAAYITTRFGSAAAPYRNFTLGAFEANRLLGALTCQRDARPKVRHIAELVGMMVEAPARRHGIGDALLRSCLDLLRAEGSATLITLSVTAGNASAIRLYERHGFERWGTLPRALRVDGVYHAKEKMALQF